MEEALRIVIQWQSDHGGTTSHLVLNHRLWPRHCRTLPSYVSWNTLEYCRALAGFAHLDVLRVAERNHDAKLVAWCRLVSLCRFSLLACVLYAMLPALLAISVVIIALLLVCLGMQLAAMVSYQAVMLVHEYLLNAVVPLLGVDLAVKLAYQYCGQDAGRLVLMVGCALLSSSRLGMRPQVLGAFLYPIVFVAAHPELVKPS